MAVPLYNFVVKHGPAVRARASLNDVTFYGPGQPEQHDTESGLAAHLLVPGENTLRLDILDAGLGEPGCYFAVMVTREIDRSEPTLTVHESHWPQVWDPLEEKERVLPYVHRATFTIDDDHPSPPWEKATPEDVPPEGTPELHQAVHKVIADLERGDGPAFIDAIGPKLDDLGRYYGPLPALSRGVQAKKYEGILASRWEVAPYDKEELLFEPRQRGRLVHVTRKDGTRAVRARNLDDDMQSIETDLVFMRRGGDWRVIR
jgi:hypothetical protein